MRLKLRQQVGAFGNDLMRLFSNSAPNSMPQLSAPTPSHAFIDTAGWYMTKQHFFSNRHLTTSCHCHHHYRWCRLPSGEFFWLFFAFIHSTNLYLQEQWPRCVIQSKWLKWIHLKGMISTATSPTVTVRWQDGSKEEVAGHWWPMTTGAMHLGAPPYGNMKEMGSNDSINCRLALGIFFLILCSF